MKNARRNHHSNWLMDYLKNNPLQVTLQIIGLGVLILNFWLASQLSPLVSDIRSITQRVEAIERRNGNNDELVVRFIVVEEKVNNIETVINRIENKIDNLR